MSEFLREGGGLFQGEQAVRAQTETTRQAAYEEAVVKRIVRRYRGTREALVTEGRRRGVSPFQFGVLQDTFPRFPVQLGSAKIPDVHRTCIAELFGSGFTKTRFFREYQKWLVATATDDRETRVAFVFNWPAISDQMVLHNYPVEQANTADPDLRRERGTRIVRPYGRPLVIYVVETLEDFLENLGSSWTEP